MQQNIRTITQQLLNRIRDEQLHYTPKELENYGFPAFLVRRISLELERNLAESVTLPDSDWADMHTDAVQDAWDHFLRAIRAETRIPASFMRSVVENAVEDILDLMAEPEQMVLDTLFRTEESATVSELEVRRLWVVVNRHLADAVVRYMVRKQLPSISRRKAIEIVRQVDAHMAAEYTPLKWAQALSVWFELMGDTVPVSMLQRYFNDQGLPAMARRFDAAEEMVSKSRLIELMSKPDLLWADSGDDSLAEANSTRFADPEVRPLPWSVDDEATELTQATSSAEPHLDWEPADEQTPGYFPVAEDPAEDHPFAILADSEPDFTRDNASESNTDPDADIPIWQRFADPELHAEPESEIDPKSSFAFESESEADPKSAFAFESESDTTPEKYAFTQAPPSAYPSNSDAFDPSMQALPDPDEHVIYLSDEAKILLTYLSENRESFTEALFRQDEASFYNSLNELVQYPDWPTAGRFITRDIFARNRIDMYSEQAVTFLDAVQQYFDENT